MDSKEFYRSIIVNRSAEPFNLIKDVPKGYEVSNANVDSCQDDFNIYIKFDKVIKDIKFMGTGCSISTSALDMVSEYIVGMTKEEACDFIDNYRAMVKGKDFDAKALKDLIALENVSDHLNRVGCALIGANTIRVMLRSNNE